MNNYSLNPIVGPSVHSRTITFGLLLLLLFTLLKDRLCAYKRNYQARSRNHCWRENSECVSVALPIQHGMRMSRIVICSLSGSTIFFHIISYTAQFSGKNLLTVKCLFWFSLQLLSETFLIVRRTQRDILIHVHKSLRVKQTFFLSHCKETCIFSTDFRKKKKKLNYSTKFHKIRPVGAELFHMDGQTDGHTDMKLAVTLRNFAYLLKT